MSFPQLVFPLLALRAHKNLHSLVRARFFFLKSSYYKVGNCFCFVIIKKYSVIEKKPLDKSPTLDVCIGWF